MPLLEDGSVYIGLHLSQSIIDSGLDLMPWGADSEVGLLDPRCK